MKLLSLQAAIMVALIHDHVAGLSAPAPKQSNSNLNSRRQWLNQAFSFGTASVAVASSASISILCQNPEGALAAETIGKDSNCNSPACLGIWDGLLADCPHGTITMSSGAGCASSQDDTPGVFAEPWDYAEAPNNSLDYNDQMRLLVPAIELVSRKRGDEVKVLVQNDRYLRVVFADGKTGEKSSGEFYFTENDTTVQFRVGTLTPALKSNGGGGALSFASFLSASTKNLDRCEMIRKELRYLKIPVLRNRKRALFFVESDMDTFGPGSAALGPPAEMTTGELEGRQDVDPKLKIDLLQGFPFQ